MSSSFPLQKVPHLALREIIDLTPIPDLIAQSLCSQRMFKMLKYNMKKSGFSGMKMYTLMFSGRAEVLIETRKGVHRICLVLAMSDLISFLISKTIGGNDPKKDLQKSNIDGFQVLTYRDSASWITFWDNIAIGIRKTFERVSYLFSLDLYTLQVEENDTWAIDWANSIVADRVPKLILKSDKVFRDEEFRHILTTYKADQLEIRTSPSKTFQFHDFSAINCHRLLIFPAFWVKIEDLIRSNFVEIEIQGSNFESQDFNQFLKCWVNGGFDKLKFANINCSAPIIMEGDCFQKLRRVHEVRHFCSPSGVKRMFNKWELKQAQGGKTASISYDNDRLVMAVW